MKILALESSALAASVAICEDDVLIAQSFQKTGLTHSATLMPMAETRLQNAGLSMEEVDVIAVAVGPGSFTGLRIGVSAAKGLAWALDKPCAPCSTLESMAWQVAHMGGQICPVMDARRAQIYNARFVAKNNGISRLTEDRAISLDELAEEVKATGETQIFVGDGALLCYNKFQQLGIPCMMAPEHLRFQTAWGVAKQAFELTKLGKLVSASELTPEYHRLSQAERERLSKQGKD